MANRGNWGSRLGFILAAAGSAVGLGNIWKFPYITGVYGGGAFVLVYLGFILIVGLPIMISELVIGHRAKKNPVGAFRELAGKKSLWQSAGWLGVASGFIILSFYSVVAGQAMAYIFKAISGFSGSAHEIEAQFTALKTNPGLSILWHTIFMGLTISIVIGGIQHGIEKWSKILMPALVLTLLGLTFYGLFFSSGGTQALSFLFKPDFSKLSSEAVLSALGHAFFTLSLGMGAMITYGSYLGKKTNLLKSAITVVLMDTVIALLAGVAIFSLVFEYGMKEGAGPGLIFQTLPVLFKETGQFISVPFFILLTFAALTSGISLLEVVVSYFIDEKGWSRTRATLLMGGSIYLIGFLPALDKLKINFQGKEQSFFDIFDFVSTNYMLPVGGLLICLFVGWIMKEKIIQSETFNS
ncbi:MAG: sodium-dependent transporter, partial [bacterium]|nr:sodium-dependent transporter [bacterium]